MKKIIILFCAICTLSLYTPCSAQNQYVPVVPEESLSGYSIALMDSTTNEYALFSEDKSCNEYQSEYSDQLSVVIRNYNEYAEAKRKNYPATSLATLRKALVSSQGRLKTIRREAGAHGCNISASSYETKMP